LNWLRQQSSQILPPTPSRMNQDEEVSFRFLVTTKEAGGIIGKNGDHIAKVRNDAGVKIGVSRLVPKVNERVVTITGSLEKVAMVLCV
jgi:predicted PilT family ATPase